MAAIPHCSMPERRVRIRNTDYDEESSFSETVALDFSYFFFSSEREGYAQKEENIEKSQQEGH